MPRLKMNEYNKSAQMRMRTCFRKFFLSLKFRNTIIIEVSGGFGDQIRHYLVGQIIKKKTKNTVKYDLSWYEIYGRDCEGRQKRKFALTKVFPNIDFPVASQDECRIFKKYLPEYENKYNFIYNEEIFKMRAPYYFTGYFMTAKHFEEVREFIDSLDFNLDLSGKNRELLKKIQSTNSIAIHVRRGDFVGIGFAICDKDYYLRAIETMVKEISSRGGPPPQFYFFSDDINWVKENIGPEIKHLEHYFAENNDNDTGYVDLFLITQCKHLIGSNSNFGLLGGLFNKNKDKIVITPNRWRPKDGTRESNKGSEGALSFQSWIALEV